MGEKGPKPIEAAVKDDVRKRVLELITELQEQRLDSLNIGNLIERKNPKLWRQIGEN